MSDFSPKNSSLPSKILFLLFPKTHLLDMAGPAQVFYEANQLGQLGLEIIFSSLTPDRKTEQGLNFSNLVHPEEVALGSNDFIIIPGIDFRSFQAGFQKDEIQKVKPWLQSMLNKGVRFATICTGSLLLADSGLLNGRYATCHWKCIEYFKEKFSAVKVVNDMLFVKDNRIYSSAGMSSGIDMCLAIIEELYGPLLASKTAREMVIFLRRNKEHDQETVYLDYQTHFNSSIHKVQNYMMSHPEKNLSLKELASEGNMSIRNLTRAFKEVTGHTITEFKHELKIELAKSYLHNPDFTIEAIARKCGFKDVRQLRRIWKSHMTMGLNASRRNFIQ